VTTDTTSLASFTTIFGATVSGTILSSDALTPTLHNWSADSSGLYHTGTNLAAEWEGYYQTMLSGNGASLTDIQRLEGNAEAVFENTGLSKLDATTQERDREDVQRQYDAMSAAMTLDGINQNAPLTEQTYLQIEYTIQGSPTLQELFMQGHGLNNSGISRYAGYTNDFQNNVDETTRFVGGGILNNGGKAIADFFDDNGLSHIGFSVVSQNGVLEQLNQNGDAENTLFQAIVALNDSMVYRVYTSVDFASHGPTAATNKASDAAFYTTQDQTFLSKLEAAAASPAPAGEVKTLYGFDISNTITFNAGNGITHVWVANAAGLFQTTTNLAAEWRAAYVDLVTTGGKDLTVEQRMKANAEAFFENTGLSKLTAAAQEADREDVQRQFDAEFMAMKLAGIDPAATFTDATYLELSQTLRSNAALDQLAIEGHGLNDPPSSIYGGYTNAFQNNIDDATKYIGAGPDHDQAALPDVFDDIVLGHSPFPVVVKNGKLVQLNQNGKAEVSLANAVKDFNYITHQAAFDARDFAA
jgi:hypothetical protein